MVVSILENPRRSVLLEIQLNISRMQRQESNLQAMIKELRKNNQKHALGDRVISQG